jgi:hypothetical protein
MHSDRDVILAVLDECSDAYAFPMLDNGYLYLAGTRMSLYRSRADWAIVIEVFGFSPRAGLPDNHIHTFASRLFDRDPPERYVSREAYEKYLAKNPHNESRFIYPIDEGPWQDQEDSECVAEDASQVLVRGQAVPVPALDEYPRWGVVLERPPRVQVFELCRALAEMAREQVLATPGERRISVLPEMRQIMQLEEWHHPDVVVNDRPSASDTFQQLAEVLVTGDPTSFRPARPANTHWRHWPDGGRL